MVYSEEDSYKRREFFNAFSDYIFLCLGNVFQLFKPSDEAGLIDFYYKNIGIEEGDKVLDVGCGSGIIDIKLSNLYNNIEIQGIDISDIFLDKGYHLISASCTQDKVKLKQGDFHYLSSYYPENYFDKIILLESFSYAVNKGQLLKEIKKVLKPGGQVFIKDIFKPNLGNKNSELGNKLNAFIDELKTYAFLFPIKIQELIELFVEDFFTINGLIEPEILLNDKELSKKRLEILYKFGVNVYSYSDLFKYKIESNLFSKFLFLETYCLKFRNTSVAAAQ